MGWLRKTSWLQFLCLMAALFVGENLAYAATAVDATTMAATNAPLEFMRATFAVGSFWFGILIAAEVVVLLLSIGNESGVAAGISLVVFAAMLQWVCGVDLILLATSNPFRGIAVFLSYIVFAGLWAAFRFNTYYNREVQALVDQKASWIRNNVEYKDRDLQYNEVPDHLIEKWNNHIDNDSPHMMQCKAKILRWAGYWWVDAVVYFFSDLTQEFFGWLYNQVSGVFIRWAKNIRQRAKLPVPAAKSSATMMAEDEK